MPKILLALLMTVALAVASPPAAARCGDLLAIDAADRGGFKASLATPDRAASAVLVLLPGGGGAVHLDAEGCVRNLAGNSLVRAAPLFRAAGLATALADAPAELQGREGLGGYRIEPKHAEALGLLVRELRRRFAVPVWIVGTSRGAISAANAASRLTGDAAADGVVLTSPVSVGTKGGAMPWTVQSVFDLPLDRIGTPLLVLGHEGDRCFRSPPGNLARIAEAATASPRKQVVIMTGGPGSRFGGSDLGACEGREPHGFVDQEADMVAGILRFVQGGKF